MNDPILVEQQHFRLAEAAVTAAAAVPVTGRQSYGFGSE
jgi:hypothetical protein